MIIRGSGFQPMIRRRGFQPLVPIPKLPIRHRNQAMSMDRPRRTDDARPRTAHSPASANWHKGHYLSQV